MQLTPLELLAPAKNKDIGIAAIDCGADAVYIAGPSFGAREAAGNEMSDIASLVRYAHIYNAKVYLAINTILFDNELEKAQSLIISAYEAGCDAIIIQDLGILKMSLPPIPVFASTQCNIRTPEQAVFLESLGCKRLILARELSIDDIRKIRSATNCQLESFIHGALCVCYSGQCYMSQYLCGRSANRGNCAQACRSRYDLIDNHGTQILNNKALLSLKDISLGSHIGELVEAGITSFKIEGRLKNISYVKNIVRYYRALIDDFLSSPAGKNYKKSSFGVLQGGFHPDPELTFTRGYTDYFISGKRDGKLSTMDTAKSIGEPVGYVSRIISNNSRGCKFTLSRKKSDGEIANGDGLCFLSPSQEVVGMRIDVVSSETISTKYSHFLRIGTPLFRNYNSIFEKELAHNMPRRLIPVEVFIVFNGQSLSFTATAENGNIAHLEVDDCFLEARNSLLAEGNLRKQISKNTDCFSFTVGNILSPDTSFPFFPLARINAIRRDLAKMLLEQNKSLHCDSPIPTGSIIPPVQTDRLNCSNHLSRSLYESIGIHPEHSFEEIFNTPKDFPLMTTKYCIRFELGLCPRQDNSQSPTPLYLINQGRKFKITFHCVECFNTITHE